MTYGSVMASFNVEEFGTERVQRLTHDEINGRFEEFRRMTHLEPSRSSCGPPAKLGHAAARSPVG